MKKVEGMAMINNARKNKRCSIWNNRGVSFVELLIAMVLLLIVLGPIMRAIISGLEVNRNSRKLMCATDAGQNIIEGISGKSFVGLRASYDPALSALAGFEELARVGGKNTYNENGNIIKTWGTAFDGLKCNSLSKFSLTLSDGSDKDFYTKRIALCENVEDTNDSFYLFKAFGTYGLGKMTDTTEQKLVLHGDASSDHYEESKVLFFAYYNVPWEGYKFDIVGYVIPATTSTASTFYPCIVRIGVYEVKKDGTHELEDNSQPMMTISDGLRYR